MISRLLELDRRWSAALLLPVSSRLARGAAALLAHSGDSWFWGAGLVLVWLLSDAGWKDWALRLFIAIGVTAAMVTGLKFIIRRQRPQGEWGAIYRKADPHSFPSGHAARAVLIALLIVSWGPSWLVPLILVWAPLVPLARVAMGLHYISDTVAGALFGALVAAIVLWLGLGAGF